MANQIDESYGDTPYAALAGLQKAKALLETQERKAAVATLEQVANEAGNSSLHALRIRMADGDMDGVISDIDGVINEEAGLNPGEFLGQYEALKGDAYRLLGKVEKARHAYIAALRSATLEQRLLQLKLDDLGPPPVSFAGMANKEMQPESKK